MNSSADYRSNLIQHLLAIAFSVILIWPIKSSAKNPEVGGDFSLTDHNSQQFELQQLRGKIVLLFFGYTYCPDICPTELAEAAQLVQTLGSESRDIQILFVTVDPSRDTPEHLKEYMSFFSPNMIGLSGSDEEIKAVTAAYHVQSQSNRKSASDQNYTVDHSASLFVIDQTGKLASIVPYGFPRTHVGKIVRHLLRADQGDDGA
ncbi:MAG: SCO family protein [Granulosicoccus sp.]